MGLNDNGTIKKQSIIGTIYTFLGALIGFVISGLLFPHILTTQEVGLLSIIVSYAMVLSTFSNLGFTNVIVRFFPYFRDKSKKHNGFLFIILIVPIIGFLITSAIFLLFKDYFIAHEKESTELLSNYFIYTIPVSGALIFFNTLDTYYRGLYNVLIGTFLKEVFQRVVILIGIVLYYYSIFNFKIFVISYVFAYAFPIVIMIISLILEHNFSLKPQLNFLDKNLSKALANMAMWNIISSFAGVVILNIDKIMLERLNGLSDTGIYSIAFFFGTLVILPSRPLLKIASAFIAQAWKENNINRIKSIYTKTSINQMFIALLILLGLWCNIDNVFHILPQEYESGKYVILFIGLTFLVEMTSGSSSIILVNSKYYKVQTIIIVLLIGVAIITNYIFIPIWGITGAAFASLIAKLFSNSIRVVFLKHKFRMFPFNIKHLILILSALFTYAINTTLPTADNFIIDIIYRSSIISIIFIGLTIIFNVSQDVNNIYNSLLLKIKKLIK